MATFLNGMKSYAVDAVTSQLPGLIETAEPQIEAAMRRSLRDMRAKHPENVQMFFANWNKLNAAVQQEMRPSVLGGAKKRTRKASSRRSKRTSKNAV